MQHRKRYRKTEENKQFRPVPAQVRRTPWRVPWQLPKQWQKTFSLRNTSFHLVFLSESKPKQDCSCCSVYSVQIHRYCSTDHTVCQQYFWDKVLLFTELVSFPIYCGKTPFTAQNSAVRRLFSPRHHSRIPRI